MNTLAVEICIDEQAEEDDKVRMVTVKDYIVSAAWCHGIEPTD